MTLNSTSMGTGEPLVALWGKNLTDREFVADAVASIPGVERSVYGEEPRIYGPGLTYTY